MMILISCWSKPYLISYQSSNFGFCEQINDFHSLDLPIYNRVACCIHLPAVLLSPCQAGGLSHTQKRSREEKKKEREIQACRLDFVAAGDRKPAGEAGSCSQNKLQGYLEMSMA